jgi:HD-GYP domain-containing protein (c-di-GMP phosphodiesterase class II)
MSSSRAETRTPGPSLKMAVSRHKIDEPGWRSNSTRHHCRQTLDDATSAVSGHNAALYVTNLHGQLECVLDCGLPVSTLDRMASAARACVDAWRPVTLADATDCQGRSKTESTDLFAAPCSLDGEIVAIAVVGGVDARTRSAEELVLRIQPFLLSLALLVDRLRSQRVLEDHVDEVTALRSQLDAYALDFRLTYSAEKNRSAQLASALAELEETYKATVRGLAIAVEAKDECTGGHLLRVSRYGMMLTAIIAPDHADDLQFQYGFLLHDIGKLTVPDVVLTKAGPLTDDEWDLMRAHPTAGRTILEGIPFLSAAREIVYAHHERWDGKGYPLGLVGDEIPLGAQIFPLCDAFDAMTSDRPYRMGMSVDQARSELLGGRGTQFRPDVVDAFLSVSAEELDNVRETTSSDESV